MTFEEKIRQDLADTPYSDKERRSLLKIIIGEMQRIPPTQKRTDESGHKVIKDMIKSNATVMSYYDPGDHKYDALASENEVLTSFLPLYWSEAKVLESLAGVDLKACKNEGAAIGMAMKVLKGLDAPVEGETVKKVVLSLRA